MCDPEIQARVNEIINAAKTGTTANRMTQLLHLLQRLNGELKPVFIQLSEQDVNTLRTVVRALREVRPLVARQEDPKSSLVLSHIDIMQRRVEEVMSTDDS